MSDPEFTGNETGPYEDPRDNFHYHNHLDPAHQYNRPVAKVGRHEIKQPDVWTFGFMPLSHLGIPI